MATTEGVKEYTIRINGIDASIKDVTKLEDAVKALDGTVKTSNATVTASAKASGTRAKALTDEEKAAKKLADTQARLQNVNSEANRAQIQANQQLRERTREVTRQIQVTQLAEGSIAQMGMQLTDLRNQYEDLSAAERNEQSVGGDLLKQIQALDAEYKALRESTGNFRDSVGNYGRALEGLDKLKVKLTGAADASVGLANDLLGSEKTMALFGTTSLESSKEVENLQRIILIATAATQLYTAVTKEGVVADALAGTIAGIRVVQLRAQAAAQALATRGTVLATIAQAAFNLVASANPYVLLALALVAVGAALFAFAKSSDNATASQKALNDEEAVFLDMLDREGQKLKQASDQRVAELERQLKVLEAQQGKQKETRALEDQIAKERLSNNTQLRGLYKNELDDLEKNRQALEDYQRILDRLNIAKAKGMTKLDIDVNLDGKVDHVDIEKAIESVQGTVDNLGRKVQVAVELNTQQADLEAEQKVVAAQRAKADRDLAKQRAKDAKAAAKERADAELAAIRAEQDAALKLEQNGYDRARQQTKRDYDRQIEDIKQRLKTETNLTKAARAALNDTIVDLVQQQALDLDALAKERDAKEQETLRQAEDTRTALIVGQMERRRVEINIQYDRQAKDLQKRLDTETDLTDAQQKAITEMIVNSEKERAKELDALSTETFTRRTALEVKQAEDALKQVQDRIGKTTARSTTGFKLIDVDATRENLKEVNAALDEYIKGLTTYQDNLTIAHNATVANLQKGSIEYDEAVQSYGDAMDAVTKRIKDALKQQTDNAKESSKSQITYYHDLFEKISDYAGLAVEAVSSVMSTLNTGLQVQLDDLNAQLDVINDKYDAAKEEREAAVESVESLEERLQAATGGTADALKSQLADAMHARQESEREEARLAKEKEKREADIAKREKQMRRNDLIGGIAQGIANTAEAVTKALTLVWPLNLVMAAIVGAAGAVQVGIMTRQLTKLAKGGPIKGPSHAQGGVNINVGGKPSYEAQGGEFMVNDVSYAANAPLVQAINDANGPLSLADVAGLTPVDATPSVVTDIAQSSQDRVIDAINAINIRPVVAVTDILDAADQVTTVQELSGFE